MALTGSLSLLLVFLVSHGVSAMRPTESEELSTGSLSGTSDPESVAQEFFECCEKGKGWTGCSKFVAGENVPFHIQAVDALPAPPVADIKLVKDYLNWMAGVVNEFGANARFEVKAHGFKNGTAIIYAVFMGYSDYVYTIQIDPSTLKVTGMKKVWNDQFAKVHIPGASFIQQAEKADADANVAEMMLVSQNFFDCCETGKGWAGCSRFVTGESAPFSIQAVDALPGPKVTDSRSVKDYLEWMAGVVGAFGEKASYTLVANAFDSTTHTAMFDAVFMGYSDYVYLIEMDAASKKVSGMTKVWNDQYARDKMPGPPEEAVS